MNIKEALEVVNSKELQKQFMPIDKSYVPQVGDILSNGLHSLITIEFIYKLNRVSSRVNKNYNDDLFKYEALKKIIRRKEIIWDQHKLDFKLFPNTNSSQHHTDEEQSIEQRKNLSYMKYCYYNNFREYRRIYESKYKFLPRRKNRVIIGDKIMVRVNHGLCDNPGNPQCYYCYFYGGKQCIALGSLIAQKFVYRGNIFTIVNKIDSL